MSKVRLLESDSQNKLFDDPVFLDAAKILTLKTTIMCPCREAFLALVNVYVVSPS